MISVIIPTYKNPEMLDLCLTSAIKGQTEQNQIIVVVDGHYEINKHIIDKWKDNIDLLNLDQNVGLCRGTNLGVYNARYDKILIVNDDNVFPLDWDEKLEFAWDVHKGNRDELECGCVMPNKPVVITPNQIEPYPSIFKQFVIENLGTDTVEFDLETFWKFEEELLAGGHKPDGATLPILMSKSDYLKVGGWDENYELGMVADWDFFLKCQLSGLRMMRTYNCHFYHFASVSANGEKRQQAEQSGHEYAKYKWGSYIKHDPTNNNKYL